MTMTTNMTTYKGGTTSMAIAHVSARPKPPRSRPPQIRGRVGGFGRRSSWALRHRHPDEVTSTAAAAATTDNNDDDDTSEPEPAVFLGNVTEGSDDVLRACAALRVQCFYRYDPGQHGDGALLFGEAADLARRRWIDKRVRAEEERMQKMEPLGMRVLSIAAVCRAPPREVVAAEAEAVEAAESARWSLDRNPGEEGEEEGGGGAVSTRTPPPSRCVVVFSPQSSSSSCSSSYSSSASLSSSMSPSPSLSPLPHRPGVDQEVVGTLDIHIGARLPGEMLEGSKPGYGYDDMGGGGDLDVGDKDVVVVGAPPGARGGHEDEVMDPEIEEEIVDVSVATVATFAAVMGDAKQGTTGVEAVLAHGVDGLDPTMAAAAVGSDEGGRGTEDHGEGYAGGGAFGGKRAYIFNVCVAKHRRRQGIAARLLRLAHRTAAEAGVQFLYVHVEKTNTAAQELYKSEGYVPESEESEWLASKLGRPARSLLVLRLPEKGEKKIKKL